MSSVELLSPPANDNSNNAFQTPSPPPPQPVSIEQRATALLANIKLTLAQAENDLVLRDAGLAQTPLQLTQIDQIMGGINHYGFAVVRLGMGAHIAGQTFGATVGHLARTHGHEITNPENYHVYGFAPSDDTDGVMRVAHPALYTEDANMLAREYMNLVRSIAHHIAPSFADASRVWFHGHGFPVFDFESDAAKNDKPRPRIKPPRIPQLYFTPEFSLSGTENYEKALVNHLHGFYRCPSDLSDPSSVWVLPGIHRCRNNLGELLFCGHLDRDTGDKPAPGASAPIYGCNNDEAFALGYPFIEKHLGNFLVQITVPDNCVVVFHPHACFSYKVPYGVCHAQLSAWSLDCETQAALVAETSERRRVEYAAGSYEVLVPPTKKGKARTKPLAAAAVTDPGTPQFHARQYDTMRRFYTDRPKALFEKRRLSPASFERAMMAVAGIRPASSLRSTITGFTLANLLANRDTVSVTDNERLDALVQAAENVFPGVATSVNEFIPACQECSETVDILLHVKETNALICIACFEAAH